MAYQQYSGVFTNTQAAQAKGQDKWVSSSIVIPGDDEIANTTLLLQANGSDGDTNNGFIDSSDNTHIITRNGNVTQGSFSPFSQDEGKWGNYFDGTGDYLGLPSANEFDFGSGDFTVETWLYATSSLTTSNLTIFDARPASTTPSSNYYFYVNSSGKLAFVFADSGGDTAYASSSTLVPNQWYHVAASRSGDTLKVFINGVVENTSSVSGKSFNSNLFRVGYKAYGPSSLTYWPGYFNNMRVVKGTAVYTSAFTPPTEPLTAITNTSLLTCQSNRFVDNSSNAHSITVNGDPEVTPFSPFAIEGSYTPATHGGSAYFDGSETYLQASDASLALGTGDFSIQFWVYNNAFDGFNGNNTLVDYRNGSEPSTQPLLTTANGQLLYYINGGIRIAGPTLELNEWYFIGLSRTSGTSKLFVNGAQVGSNYADSNNCTSQTVRIGADFDTSLNAGLNGYLSDLKVTKGAAVDFSAIGVPTAPVTSDANTSLLLNFTNAGIFDATRKNVLETVGDAQVDTAVKKYGTGSMQFDGTGDYLVAPASEQFGFGTGDFTIEGWAFTPDNTRSVNAVSQRIVDIGGGDVGVWLQSSTGYISYNAGNVTASSTVFPENQWNHFALTRSGSSLKLFLNGSEVASATNSNDLGSAHTATVGAFNNSSDGAFLGYIDDLRITKGVARYTANFTAPTEEFPNSSDSSEVI